MAPSRGSSPPSSDTSTKNTPLSTYQRRRKQRSSSWSAWATRPFRLSISGKSTKPQQERNRRKAKKSVTFEDIIGSEELTAELGLSSERSRGSAQGIYPRGEEDTESRASIESGYFARGRVDEADDVKNKKTLSLGSPQRFTGRGGPSDLSHEEQGAEHYLSTGRHVEDDWSNLQYPLPGSFQSRIPGDHQDFEPTSKTASHEPSRRRHMRTVSRDDYLFARGANPRTGVVSPSVFTPTDESSNDALTRRGDAQKWRLKGDQWVSLDMGQPTPIPTPPIASGRASNAGSATTSQRANTDCRTRTTIPLRELQDRFVVNMPSAREPNPPSMSPQQMHEYQRGIEKVQRQGGVMVDPESLPSPRVVTPEGRSTPPQKLQKKPTERKGDLHGEVKVIKRKAVGSPPRRRRERRTGEDGNENDNSVDTIIKGGSNVSHGQGRATSAPIPRKFRYYAPDDVGKDLPRLLTESQTERGRSQSQRPFLGVVQGDWIEDSNDSKDGKRYSQVGRTFFPQTPTNAGRLLSPLSQERMIPTPMMTGKLGNQGPPTAHRTGGSLDEVQLHSRTLKSCLCCSPPSPGRQVRGSRGENIRQLQSKIGGPREQPQGLQQYMDGQQTQKQQSMSTIGKKAPRLRNKPKKGSEEEDIFTNTSALTMTPTSIPTITTTPPKDTAPTISTIGRPSPPQRLDGMRCVPRVSPRHMHVPGTLPQHDFMTRDGNPPQTEDDMFPRTLVPAAAAGRSLHLHRHQDMEMRKCGCRPHHRPDITNMHGFTPTPVIGNGYVNNDESRGMLINDEPYPYFHDNQTHQPDSGFRGDPFGLRPPPPPFGFDGSGTSMLRQTAARNSLRLRRVVTEDEVEFDKEFGGLEVVGLEPVGNGAKWDVSGGEAAPVGRKQATTTTAPDIDATTGFPGLDALAAVCQSAMYYASRYRAAHHARFIGKKLWDMAKHVFGTAVKLYEVWYGYTNANGRAAVKGKVEVDAVGLLKDCARCVAYVLVLAVTVVLVAAFFHLGGWVV